MGKPWIIKLVIHQVILATYLLYGMAFLTSMPEDTPSRLLHSMLVLLITSIPIGIYMGLVAIGKIKVIKKDGSFS